jgi:hypothetical protein
MHERSDTRHLVNLKMHGGCLHMCNEHVAEESGPFDSEKDILGEM